MRINLPKNLFPYLIVALLGLAVIGTIAWLNTYKQGVLDKIEKAAGENLEGQLSVGDIGFTPFQHGIGFTFTCYDVRLEGSRVKRYGLPLLRAESVSATLDFSQLLRGRAEVNRISVDQGVFSVFVTRDGYSNASLFERIQEKIDSRRADQKPQDFFGNLRTIEFYDCPISYVDSLKNKKYAATLQKVKSSLSRTDTSRHFNLDGAVYFHGLVFNAKKGGFLRAQSTQVRLNFGYQPQQRLWRINPSTIKVADPKVDTIRLSGKVDLRSEHKMLSLDFRMNRTDLGPTLKLLTRPLEKTLRRRKILPYVQANIRIRSALNDPNPWTTIEFQTDTFQYALPYGTLRGVKGKGTFTNRYDPALPVGDENSRIDVSHISGYLETIPLRGRIVINNLKVAKSVMDFTIEATPANVNALLADSPYRVGKGQAWLKFRYEGSPVKFYDPKRDRMTGKLRGALRLRDISIRNDSNQIDISQLNGDITFDQDQLKIPKLMMHDGRNDLDISGIVRRLPAALSGSFTPAEALVHIAIPRWEVTWPDRLASRRKSRKPRQRRFRLTRLLDETIDNLKITASLAADEMRYHQLVAKKVRGTIQAKQGLIEMKNLSMNTCGGAVSLSGGFKTNENQALPVFYASGSVKNTDIQSVFRSLGNFGQKTITDQNLRGILTADFAFESKISNDTSFVLPSMKGFVDLTLNKVSILNFEPMLKIRKLIFKNRAWDDVQLAPLRTRLVLRGEDIIVDRMKIQANVLYFFLDGVYSFGNRTNLSIQIPMNNLKRKLPDNRFDIQEVKDVQGNVIFLRAQSEGDEVKIKYDKMKRFK